MYLSEAYYLGEFVKNEKYKIAQNSIKKRLFSGKQHRNKNGVTYKRKSNTVEYKIRDIKQ